MTDATRDRLSYTVKNTFVEIPEEDGTRKSQGLPRCSSESSMNSNQVPPSPAELRAYSVNSSSPQSSSECTITGDITPRGTPSDTSPMKVSPETIDICARLVHLAMAQNTERDADGWSWSEADVNDLATSKAARQKLRESLKDLIPLDKEGNKMSIGSILHSSGHCRPCYFWTKRRCSEGECCLRCHCSLHDYSKDRGVHRFCDRRRMIFENEGRAQDHDAHTSGLGGDGSTKSSPMSNSTDSSSVTMPASESGMTTPPMLEDQQDLVDVPIPSMGALDLYQRVIVRERGNSLRVSTDMISPDELKEHIPLDPEGNFTSIGSIMHNLKPVGEHCKICMFWYKHQCKNGKLCAYCHILHRDKKMKKLRPSKATRDANRYAGAFIGSDASSQYRHAQSACDSREVFKETLISL